MTAPQTERDLPDYFGFFAGCRLDQTGTIVLDLLVDPGPAFDRDAYTSQFKETLFTSAQMRAYAADCVRDALTRPAVPKHFEDADALIENLETMWCDHKGAGVTWEPARVAADAVRAWQENRVPAAPDAVRGFDAGGRYWRERAEFWRGVAVALGWREVRDEANGESALAAPAVDGGEFKGWYCAHCQRGVDGSEVTYHEQHQECGRVITDDRPTAPTPPADVEQQANTYDRQVVIEMLDDLLLIPDASRHSTIAIVDQQNALRQQHVVKCFNPCTPIDFFNGNSCSRCVAERYSPAPPPPVDVAAREALEFCADEFRDKCWVAECRGDVGLSNYYAECSERVCIALAQQPGVSR